ncbi:MAG TPA: hypothetical protein DGH68_03675 [Bacteroidetes bacterium]|nr:hypothetical protein [Bacteroidota bacterium]
MIEITTKLNATVILFLFLTCSVFGQEKREPSGNSRDTIPSELQQIASQWLRAYNGTDAQELAPMYTQDAQYISSHVAGLVANGRDRLIANFQTGMSSGGHIDSIQVLSINVSCDLATVLCR